MAYSPDSLPLYLRQESILDRRTWVYYLIIVDRVARRWSEQLKVRPDARFYEVLSEHVKAYVDEGKLPPAAIQSAVLNVADDLLAGREIVLRAGDYIAVQNFARRGR